MTNPKGTRTETELVKYLRGQGFSAADRIPRKGAKDEGDVWLAPGRVMIEVKDSPSKYASTIPPEKWLKETASEQANSGAPLAFLVVKPAGLGYTRTRLWHAWISALYLTDQVAVVGVFASPTVLPVRIGLGDLLSIMKGDSLLGLLPEAVE